MVRRKGDKSEVLVPLETWFGNSPDLVRAGKTVDIGALGESLLYYDSVLMDVNDGQHLGAILDWFAGSCKPESFLGLLESGDIWLYHYNFVVNPIYDPRIDAYIPVNLKWERADRLEDIRKIGLAVVDKYFNSKRLRARFWNAVGDASIIVEADTFGKAVENAKTFVADPDSCRSLLNHLFESMKTAGFIPEVPDFKLSTRTSKTGATGLEVNLNLDEIGRAIGDPHAFGKHTPIAIATSTNRYLWSCATGKCDLYTNEPLFGFLQDQMMTAVKHFAGLQEDLGLLTVQTGIPNIRDQVNAGLINADDVLKLRQHAQEYRKWLHAQVNLDRDVVAAYYNDEVECWPISRTTKNVLKGATQTAVFLLSDLLMSRVAGVESKLLSSVVDLASAGFSGQVADKVLEGWTPKIFGNKVRDMGLLRE